MGLHLQKLGSEPLGLGHHLQAGEVVNNKPRKPLKRSYIKRKSRLRFKSAKKSMIRAAEKRAEDAWKQAVEHRAKGICEVHGASCKPETFQVDHFRSRRHARTFYMPENGTFVCAALNRDKAMGWNNAAEKIAFVVLKREGQAMVDQLLQAGSNKSKPQKFSPFELAVIAADLDRMFLSDRQP